jgi:dual specificity tyrosine-phosphorylation-regulated kinase 2/3/4
MTQHERSEICEYPQVWYLGLDSCKVHPKEDSAHNGGYDDENGSYHKVLHDQIGYRYEILEVIGRGSFGQVIRALDHKTNSHVAIKIIRFVQFQISYHIFIRARQILEGRVKLSVT